MFDSYLEDGRNKAIDFLKLYASILVILGHSMFKFISIGAFANPLYNCIWLTQMPLFMFLSGFLNIKKEKYSKFNLYLYKEAKNALILLWPCFTFMLIICAWYQTSLFEQFKLFYQTPNLWFLWALFIIHLVFDFGLYLANKIKNKFSIVMPLITSISVSLIIVVLSFLLKDRFDFSVLSLKLIAYYIPFYCFGYLFHFLLPKINKWKIASLIVIALAFIILAFECFYFKSIQEFDDGNIKYVAIRYIGSISAIIVSLFIANYLTKLKFISRLSKFGQYSLQSYYLHIIFLRLINFSSGEVALQYLLSFGVTAIMIAMTAGALIIMYFIPYLHLLVFGRSKSIYKFEKKLPKIFQ